MEVFTHNRGPRLLLALCVFGILTGLASAADHRVKVEAMNHPLPDAAHATSYWIHSGNPMIAETSLRFWDTSRHIKTALSAHGLFEAHDEASADLIVTIDFGMKPGAPRFERTLLPVYGDNLDFPVASALDPRGRWMRATDFTQVIGYEEFKVPVAAHEKFLDFSAVENKPAVEGRPPVTVWRISASIDDESTDLRANLPVLAAVLMQSIGHETNGPAFVRITDRSPAIAFIKKGR